MSYAGGVHPVRQDSKMLVPGQGVEWGREGWVGSLGLAGANC